MKKHILIRVVSGFLLSFGPQIALAQDIIPPGPWTGQALSPGTITELIASVTTWLFGIATFIMVIAFIWAGVTYMTAGSDAQKVTKAKNIFKYGVIGAVIIFAIGTILATIQLIVSSPGTLF